MTFGSQSSSNYFEMNTNGTARYEKKTRFRKLVKGMDCNQNVINSRMIWYRLEICYRLEKCILHYNRNVRYMQEVFLK